MASTRVDCMAACVDGPGMRSSFEHQQRGVTELYEIKWQRGQLESL